MKHFFILLLFTSGNVFAQADDPNMLFSASNNQSAKMSINWIAVDDVNAVCNKERKTQGQSTFGYSIKACSFWNYDAKTCTIITKKNTNMHTLGHEMRHCFQGNWHGD